ncbi:MAG: carbohydrate ABC transporter permease [Bilifractor sp.]|nr:carbohydrate ABC transporter permease [Lachnospiraceae bacterium]MDY2837695.1 carbohydrate ABC transporter permease [Bilifractor sp.]
MSSLKSNSDILLGMLELPKQWMFSNYPEAVKTANALNTILHSLIIAISTLVLTIAVGFPAAYILARKSYKFIKPVYILFMAGVMVPVHCTLTSVSEMASTLGLKNSYIFLVLLYVAFNLSQAIFLFTSYIRGLDKGLDEAAKIDGCSEMRLIWTIIFPLCKPIVATEAILVFIFGYSELIFSLILLTDQRKYTVSRAMLNFTSNYTTSYGPQFAFVIMSMIPMLVIYIVLHKQIQEGMLSGAIKG